MNLRFALPALILPALLLVSCSGGSSPGFFARTAGSSSEGTGSQGYCSPRKHACEKYQKELRKKNGRSDKAEAYRVQCAEYNKHCR